MIEVLATGPLATVQDLGRPGWAALGVPRSGAFDRGALRLANRLVGNPEGAAGIEVTLGGLALRLPHAVTVALTGAECPGGPCWNAATTLPGGAELVLGTPARGVRTYLAVRGGVAVEAVLGSRATDVLSGLGPPRLAAGMQLAVGPQPGAPVSPASGIPRPAPLRVVLGPRDDWFADPDALFATDWTVAADADRVGLRLLGPPLARRVDGELPSEPTRPGALQVPPDGRPILFGPDAPVTGGYPVIGVLDAAGLDAAAQLRPGDGVRFTPAAGAGA